MLEVVTTESCEYCGFEQNQGFTFCSSCGKRNSNKDKREENKFLSLDKNIQLLGWYSIITIAFVIVGALTENTLEMLLVFSILLAVIDLGFVSTQPEVWKLYSIKNFKLLPAIAIFLICIVTAFIVSFTMDYLNSKLFEQEYSLLELFTHLDHPLLYAILLVAVYPAIFEEMAYRGFVYNSLDKINGYKSALWGSTFLFAISHISLLSIIWIIPFGLMLAFFRAKYSSIYYGMIGHFTHNATILLIEYYSYQNNTIL